MEWIKAKAEDRPTLKLLGDRLLGWVEFHNLGAGYFTAHPEPKGMMFATEEMAKAAVLEHLARRNAEERDALEKLAKILRKTAHPNAAFAASE